MRRVSRTAGHLAVVVPKDASVGSAARFPAAPFAFQSRAQLAARSTARCCAHANRLLGEMADAGAAVVRAAITRCKITVTRVAYMRYIGQGHEIPVALPDGELAVRDVPALSGGSRAALRGALRPRAIPGLRSKS